MSQDVTYHLFCRLLTVSIISLSVSTICSISSFGLCSVHGIFTIRLQTIFQMPQVVKYLLFVESTFRFHTTQHSKQMLLPYVSSSEGWGILAWVHFSCWMPLFPKALCCVMNRKVKSLKQTVFLSEQCAVSKVITSVRSAVFQPWHRYTIVLLLVCLFIALSITHCSKSAQKFAVLACQVPTVVMATMQLVLRQV